MGPTFLKSLFNFRFFQGFKSILGWVIWSEFQKIIRKEKNVILASIWQKTLQKFFSVKFIWKNHMQLWIPSQSSVMYSWSSLMLYVHYCKPLNLWIFLVLPKGRTTMIFSHPGPKSESIESVNFLRRIEPQTNVMPKSFTLGGFSHSAVECSLERRLKSF